jgi:hypothetical protein
MDEGNDSQTQGKRILAATLLKPWFLRLTTCYATAGKKISGLTPRHTGSQEAVAAMRKKSSVENFRSLKQPAVRAASRGLVLRASAGAVEEEVALAGVAREGGGAGELLLGFGEAAELEEEIAADAGQKMIGLERRLGRERID